MVEVWKEIANYPDYDVSSLGRVRSWRRWNRVTPKILAAGTTKAGYRLVVLYDVHGNKRSHNVHRLVAAHFLPDFDEALQVNHKRGAEAGDAVDNLEMETHAGNLQHAFRVLGRTSGGTGRSGALNSKALRYRVTHPSGSVEEILGLSEFCAANGLSRGCMTHVVRGKQKHHRGYKIERIENE